MFLDCAFNEKLLLFLKSRGYAEHCLVQTVEHGRNGPQNLDTYFLMLIGQLITGASGFDGNVQQQSSIGLELFDDHRRKAKKLGRLPPEVLFVSARACTIWGICLAKKPHKR